MVMRIALLGTDNTHGHQFAGYINGWSRDVPIPVESKHGFLPQFYTWAKTLREAEHNPEVPVPSPDARVTSIWCPDRDGAGLVARACGIEHHAASPQEAMRDADAVLVLTEDPHTHFELAKPALERGLPTLIDKPLSLDADTNRRLAEIADANDAPWFTGSAFRFSPSLQRFSSTLNEISGGFDAAYIAVPGPLAYYGIHAVEIANRLVPLRDVERMQGFSTDGRAGALLTLSSSPVTLMLECLQVTAEPPGHALVYGNRGLLHWQPDDTYTAMQGMVSAFLEMAKTGVSPVPPEEGLRLAQIALELTRAAEG